MKILVRQKINELEKIIKDKYDIDVSPFIIYDSDSSRTLGYYKLSENSIHLNEKLLDEFGELYIKDIVIHEFVHAVVNTLFPSRYNRGKKVMPHCKEFKSICILLGIPPKATTNVFNNSTSMKKQRTKNRIDYSCNCMTHSLTTYKHNKIQRGCVFTCRLCHTQLKLKGL